MTEWLSIAPAACDVCAGRITSAFVDGWTTFGPWGALCLDCWPRYGAGRLGPGFGQRYDLQPSGRWLQTAGGASAPA